MTKQSVDPLDIDLDPENPRLPEEERSTDQRRLLHTLIHSYKVEEVALSIAASGYIPLDPVIAYKRDGKLRVREGNRRIAALKALKRPDELDEPYKKRFKELAESLTDAKRRTLDKIDVDVHDTEEEDIESYVGFRHVTGTLPWGPEEKARFVANMVDKHGQDFKGLAARFGSYPKHIERLYVAFKLAAQAREEELDGATEVRLGVLIRALQVASVPAFLGIEFSGNPATLKTPVPEDHLAQLGEFLVWVFGTEERPALFSDSRKLTSFGDVLKAEDAMSYLRSTPQPEFDVALRLAHGGRGQVLRNLAGAAVLLEQVAGQIVDYADDPKVADEAVRCGRRLTIFARDVKKLDAFLHDWAKGKKTSGTVRRSPKAVKKAKKRGGRA